MILLKICAKRVRKKMSHVDVTYICSYSLQESLVLMAARFPSDETECRVSSMAAHSDSDQRNACVSVQFCVSSIGD